MLVSNASLVVLIAHQARFWSFRHVKKISTLIFFISASKIHLVEVPTRNPDHHCNIVPFLNASSEISIGRLGSMYHRGLWLQVSCTRLLKRYFQSHP
jgi:hypothetical protein